MPPSLGRHPPASPVPAPRATRRQALGVGEPDAGGHFPGRAWEDDRVGGRAEDGEPVGLVDQELVGLRQNAVRADDRLEGGAPPYPIGPRD